MNSLLFRCRKYYSSATIPIKSQKFIPEMEEKEKTYCLFSSPQPLFPLQQIRCTIRVGNLKTISHPLLYTMLNPQSQEINQVGIILHSSVQQQLKKQMTANEINLSVKTKEKNFRAQITEIMNMESGLFAKAIPYNDIPIEPFDQKPHLQEIYDLIGQLQKQIKKDKFEQIFDHMESDINRFTYESAMNISIVQSFYFRQMPLEFIQELIEATNGLMRLELIKKQLNTTIQNLNVFNTSSYQFQEIHPHEQAKYALQYIKSIYLQEGVDMYENYKKQKSPYYKKPKSQLKKNYNVNLIPDPASREKIKQEIERFNSMDKNAFEYNKINTYLDEVFSVPWDKYTPVEWNMDYAKQILDQEIQGLDKVKERILEMIAVNRLKNSNEQSKGFVLVINGPPGTGKTSIAKAIAKCLKRESRFISCAGVLDPHFFKGHRRTYIDSQPGVFIKELIKAQTMNPVLILDEIDKISKNNADPYYSLLEILNTEENENFTDHYLDIQVDFSKVIFILTANQLVHILEPLLNRLEIIDVPAYIQEEKLEIAKNFVIGKAFESCGIQEGQIKYDDDVIMKIIKKNLDWCFYESGVRELKRCFEKIGRQFASEILKNDRFQENSPEMEVQQEQIERLKEHQLQEVGSVLDLRQDKNLELLQRYLGPIKFHGEERSMKLNPPGQVNLLTTQGMIGNVLQIECCYDKGKGLVSSSGNIKQVLQESVQIAKIYAYRCLNEQQKKKLQQNNVHIHFLEASSKKDGSDGGVAVCTALISLASNQGIAQNLAVAGELSLNGEILRIDEIQGKLIAAKTLNIQEIVLPKANQADVLELPKALTQGLKIYLCSHFSQIQELVFNKNKMEDVQVIE